MLPFIITEKNKFLKKGRENKRKKKKEKEKKERDKKNMDITDRYEFDKTEDLLGKGTYG